MSAIRSKDTTGLIPAAPFLPYETLSNALLSPDSAVAPKNHGHVALIVQRPAVNQRVVVDEAHLSTEHGMQGSGWVERPERGTVDQICVMSVAAIRAIAGDDMDRWPAAGDQLFIDLDLGKENLNTGDRVEVGEGGAVLEVTSKPHNGCAKFAMRYGEDALKIVNAPLGKKRRLRGIYFRVVTEGIVKVGDHIVKIEDEEEEEEEEES